MGRSSWFCTLSVLAGLAAVLVGLLTVVNKPQEDSGGGGMVVKMGSGKMFDAVAKNYDVVNKYMTLGWDMEWRSTLVSSLKIHPNDQVLDLATGTADVALLEAVELDRLGGKGAVLGVDPSVGMLEVGRTKVKEAGMEGRIELQEGDAQNLVGVPDNHYHKISMSFGIRNVEDRKAALREMWRVAAKSNDTIIAIMEVALPTSGVLKALANVLVRYIVPTIGMITSGLKDEYTHLQRSIINFPPPDEFAQLMTDVGLVVYEVKNVAFTVIQLYLAHPLVPSTTLSSEVGSEPVEGSR